MRNDAKGSLPGAQQVNYFAQGLESTIGAIGGGTEHSLFQVVALRPEGPGAVPLGKLLRAFTTSA